MQESDKMIEQIFSLKDLDQIRSYGISKKEVWRQIEMFQKPRSFVLLDRACTLDDGIAKLSKEQIQTSIKVHEQACQQGRMMKFVPASGAATRMFKHLLHFLHHSPISWQELNARANRGDVDALNVVAFFDNIEQFAFFEDLKPHLNGRNPLDLRGAFQEILEKILTPKGLNLSSLPKGLLKFHRYAQGIRTAFEEHLIEALDYIQDRSGICRFHFTISPEHEGLFQSQLKEMIPRFKAQYGVLLDVRFSVQSSSTHTLAVDEQNRPFRNRDGEILFRAGGHGALIENLNSLQSDIVFIKNVDNVVPQKFQAETIVWKKILAGWLIQVQDQIFTYLSRLSVSPDPHLIREALEFLRHRLFITPPGMVASGTNEEKSAYLLDRLNRPLRVCGMIENRGEVGGGPFWVRDAHGALSIQIVERAEIDPTAKDQQEILKTSTHFNPVNIVCALRDFKGNVFDLKPFINPDAVFITQKSEEGRDLKALEHPGLWNGAMAHWNTIFIEIPSITFNPVKTINDLLRPEHQD